MRKHFFLLPSILLIALGVLFYHAAHAGFSIDYGNGLKFDFDSATVLNGHAYFVDSIEYNSEELTSGQYYLNALVATYGSKENMSHYEEDIDIVGQGGIESKVKNVSTGTYIVDELTVTNSVSPQSDMKTGASNEIAVIGSRSNELDPGNYIVDTFVQGNIVSSFRVCLPTFTSTTGKTIGSVTCPGNSNPTIPSTPPPTGPILPTNPPTQNPPTNIPTTTSTNKITPAVGVNLVATAGTPRASLSIISANIQDTSAAFQVKIRVPNTSTTLVLRPDYGTSPTNLAASGGIAYANNFLAANSSQDFDYQMIGLTPGTKYYLRFVDTAHSVTYQSTSFITAGIGPDNVAVPLTFTQQVTELVLQVDNPVVTEMPNITPKKYTVKFTGKVTSRIKQDIKLDMFFGATSTSLNSVGNLISAQTIAENQTIPFELTLDSLSDNTDYYFQVFDTSKIDAVHPVGYPVDRATRAFRTGTLTLPTIYDPNNTQGALFDYKFPENIGEPAPGTGEGSTAIGSLVPCGKKDDFGTEDQDCHFSHAIILIQNVINYLFVLLIPATVLLAIYTGVQMIIHRTMPAELTKYKGVLKRIGIGIAVMVLAWTVISTLLNALLGPEATGFDLLGLLN